MGVSSTILGRWRQGKLVGTSKHALIVRVRPGHMTRGYRTDFRIDQNYGVFPPLIVRGHNIHPWQGAWIPDGPWVELPNIENAQYSRSFADKGVSTCTVVMDNIQFTDTTGIGGLYHKIERGYFAPSRGIRVGSRPVTSLVPNSWQNVLNGGYQLELWEGYGQGTDIELLTSPVDNSYAPSSGCLQRTWTGLIVDCDLEANPDKITLTCRDFGILLTDQRLMGNNKAPECRSPITFADRHQTDGEQKLTGPLTVSSGTVSSGSWLSAGQGASSDKQWIEIQMPRGFYTDFFVAPEFDGMEMWVSLYDPVGAVMDRTLPQPAGWVDLGLGTVSGIPYIKRVGTLAESPAVRWYLGHSFDVHDGSKLRLTFSNLAERNGSWFAGTHEVAVYRFGSAPNGSGASGVNADGWVLVTDASDVIWMLMVWAGFKEWNIDTFGWSLLAPLRFGADAFFIDAVNEILKQGNFVFFMGAPTNDDRSIGVPNFLLQKTFQPLRPGTVQVRDTDMVEAMQPKWDLSSLPYVMRYRGAPSPTGSTFAGDLVKRFMATYYPPWSDQYTPLTGVEPAGLVPRVAGVVRHFTETLGAGFTAMLQSDQECLFACVLAAVQYALGMATGQVQIAGLPGLELNDQLGVVEAATGTNTRLWIASLQSDHEMGVGGNWKMTFGGAFLDTPEMLALKADYGFAWALNQREKAGG